MSLKRKFLHRRLAGGSPSLPPPTTLGWDFPRLVTIYSKGGAENTTPGKQAIAKFPGYVTDLTWAPLPMGYPAIGDQSVGEYINSLQPAPSYNWIYDHSCMMEWDQAEPGGDSWKSNETGFYVGGVRYRIALDWLLCDAGATLTGAIGSGATAIPVTECSMFWVGLHCIVGGLSGQPIEMVTVTAKDHTSGPGILTVVRGEQAQNTAYVSGSVVSVGGGYPAVAHALGAAIRPTSIVFGSSQYMFLDVTSHCPTADGGFGAQTANQWKASFWAMKLAEPHLTYLDGIFEDNFIGDPVLIFSNIASVDLTRTNTATGMDGPTWKAGMQDLAAKCRAALPTKAILANTGGNAADFRAWLNGGMIEGVDYNGSNTLIGGSYVDTLAFYSAWMTAYGDVPLFIFNASSSRSAGAWQTDYQAMRLTLTMCLIYDGLYDYDEFLDSNPGGGLNAGGHQSTAWYDEYDNVGAGVGYLGQPTGPATQPIPGVFLRPFQHGVSVCNLTGSSQTVALGGTYKRLNGTQDHTANDGATGITSQVVPARDGRVLLL